MIAGEPLKFGHIFKSPIQALLGEFVAKSKHQPVLFELGLGMRQKLGFLEIDHDLGPAGLGPALNGMADLVLGARPGVAGGCAETLPEYAEQNVALFNF